MSDTTQANSAMTMDEALALLGVETLPGLDKNGEKELLESMSRMRDEDGEDWIRENREDLVALWSAMLTQPCAGGEE